MYIYKMWLFDLFFLNSANLICCCTDISKYFRESLGIRDNELTVVCGGIIQNCAILSNG